MSSWTGMCLRSSREGVCGNNVVQFQSCNGSSYCTALGENGCMDMISRQLRDSSMVRRWCGQFTEVLLKILLRAVNLFSFSHIVSSDSSFNIQNALYFVKYPSRAAQNSPEGRRRAAG